MLAPLREQVVGRYSMACYQTVLRESMVWQANWKNLIENFTESYHVPVAHGKTFAQHNLRYWKTTSVAKTATTDGEWGGRLRVQRLTWQVISTLLSPNRCFDSVVVRAG
jgi:phenylpropionate dioxygenase-like ring-hydroxylating dioxygenase large terminal subunit